jgi:formylglycine-generating enzyme required for sulfatase activity
MRYDMGKRGHIQRAASTWGLVLLPFLASLTGCQRAPIARAKLRHLDQLEQALQALNPNLKADLLVYGDPDAAMAYTYDRSGCPGDSENYPRGTKHLVETEAGQILLRAIASSDHNNLVVPFEPSIPNPPKSMSMRVLFRVFDTYCQRDSDQGLRQPEEIARQEETLELIDGFVPQPEPKEVFLDVPSAYCRNRDDCTNIQVGICNPFDDECSRHCVVDSGSSTGRCQETQPDPCKNAAENDQENDGSSPGPVVDACGVCGGDNSSCVGCDNIPNSGLANDACGVCGGDNSSCVGCDSIPNSGLTNDACGVCGGDNSSCPGTDGCATGYQDNDTNGSCSANCTTAQVICGTNQECSDASGAAICICSTGYQDHDNDGTCTLDCPTTTLDCGATSTCNDTSGTALCVCNAGYQDNDNNNTCAADCTTAALGCSAPTPFCGDTYGTATCAATPPGMVLVPQGLFWMGCNTAVDTQCLSNESPYHPVTLDAFYMDITEVTAGDYAACVADGLTNSITCTSNTVVSPAGQGCCYFGDTTGTRRTYNNAKDNHPINYVDWYDAMSYCAWKGKSLPTEAQWEKAARGGCEKYTNCEDESFKYPWGNTITSDHAVYSGSSAPVGSKDNDANTDVNGASPYGALDMAGNVYEWTRDLYGNTYYSSSPETNPENTTGTQYRSIRGGNWDNVEGYLRSSYRQVGVVWAAGRHQGFRCSQ